MSKDCSSCICLCCDNDDCFVSMCEGAAVEPELYLEAIENCYKEECKGYYKQEVEDER